MRYKKEIEIFNNNEVIYNYYGYEHNINGVSYVIEEDTGDIWFYIKDVYKTLQIKQNIEVTNNIPTYDKKYIMIDKYIDKKLCININGLSFILNHDKIAPEIKRCRKEKYEYFFDKDFIIKLYKKEINYFKEIIESSEEQYEKEEEKLYMQIKKLEEENKKLKKGQLIISGSNQTYENYINTRKYRLASTSTVAADFDLSGRKLNNILCEEGVIYKDQYNHWHMTEEYKDKEYTEYEAYAFDNGCNISMKWTKKGCLFIADLLASRKIYPLIEKNIYKQNAI